MKLMHAINTILGNNAAVQHVAQQRVLPEETRKRSRVIFDGRISVEKVSNGYVVNIATREGYEYETYIATTIQEVNERIAASMVSFQLEAK